MHQRRHSKTVTMLLSAILFCCSTAWGDGSISVSPSAANVSASGGNGSLSVTATSSTAATGPVQVTLAGTDGMISFPSGNSAAITLKKAGTAWKGTAKFKYKVAPNTSGSVRQGTIGVNGGSPSLSVTQAGAACVPTVAKSAAKQAFDYFGGDGSVVFSIPDGCSWSASSDSVWLNVGSGSGTSGGSVNFSLADNSSLKGKARNGKVTITGRNSASASKPAGKAAVVSVSQSQRTGAGSAQIGPLTQLGGNPTAAVKGLVAAGLVANVVTGSGDGVNSMLALFPTGSGAALSTAKGVKAGLSLARLGREALASSGGSMCANPNTISITDKGSTRKVVFNGCSYGGQVLNGTVTGTVKGSGSTPPLVLTFGSATAPFTANVYNGTAIASSTAASLSMIVASTGTNSFSVTTSGNIDITDQTASARDLLDFKNYSYDYTSDGITSTYAVDGTLRNATFKGSSLTAAEETAFSNFTVASTSTDNGVTSSVSIGGTFALLFFPSDQCTSGTFQIATTQPMLITGGGIQSGEMTINSSTIAVTGTSNSQPTVTVNGADANVSLGSVCR